MHQKVWCWCLIQLGFQDFSRLTARFFDHSSFMKNIESNPPASDYTHRFNTFQRINKSIKNDLIRFSTALDIGCMSTLPVHQPQAEWPDLGSGSNLTQLHHGMFGRCDLESPTKNFGEYLVAIPKCQQIVALVVTVSLSPQVFIENNIYLYFLRHIQK